MSARFVTPQRQRHSRVAVAAFVTASAAFTAWLLTAVVALSERTVVLVVMVLAFLASWVVCNAPAASNHRATLVRARAHSR